MTLKEELKMINVTVIKKANCVQCTMTAKYLDKHHVAYSGIAIETSPEALLQAQRLGFSSVPVVIVEVDGEIKDAWSGFRPDSLERLIGLSTERQAA